MTPEYELGYADGESSVTADVDCHLNENCGQPDDDERDWKEYTLWMSQEIERLRGALQKVKEWVDDEGWCPICDEHSCREGNCVLADFETETTDDYDYAADDFAFDAAREDAFFRR
jgi:hypothetical protein